ncbi:MAG: hypothetical protein WD278_08960 [Pirellulales bacterium]
MAKKKTKLKRKIRAPAKGKKKLARTNHKPGKKAGKKIARRPAATARPKRRSTWLDEQANKPVIERQARRLGSFIEAMADGQVDQSELAAQEGRLVKLMKEVEPELPPALHDKVTRLLYELTAYDLMQILHTMEQARPKTVFHG